MASTTVSKSIEEEQTTRLSPAEGTETEVAQSSFRRGLKQCRHQLCRHSPLTFTLSASLCFLTQINLVIFMVTQITSLEKEFGFTTAQAGKIISAAQIGSLFLVLPAGHMAKRLHVPRALTLAALIFGVAGVMAGLPRFMFPGSAAAVDSSSRGSGGNASSSSSVVRAAADIPPALCWLGEGAEAEMEERCGGLGALNNGTVPDGDEATPGLEYNPRAYPVFVYLIVWQVIRGAVGSTGIPMFVEYIETNSVKTDTGFYMGIVSSVSMLGPALAFIGGGAISQLHVSLQDTELTPDHPDWVGAWWLGFLIFGALAALAPAFVWHFPRKLTPPSPPSTHPPSSTSHRRQVSSSSSSSVSSMEKRHDEDEEEKKNYCADDDINDEKERGGGEDVEEEEENEENHDYNDDKDVVEMARLQRLGNPWVRFGRRAVFELRGFFVSLFKLLLNPIYVMLFLASCFFGFSMNSTYLFLPKYLENQFHLPAWKANYIMGGGELTMGTSGFLLGGWLTKRLRLSRGKVYQLLLGSSTVGLVLVGAMVFIGCPQGTLLGQPGVLANTANCTLSCACPDEAFPVCDEQSRDMYFSPCHAGCLTLQNGVYKNCSCTASGQAHPGECTSDCSAVYYFAVVFYIYLFAVSLAGPLHYLVTVRSVPESQVGLAVGFNSFVTGIVTFLVGPIFFGGLIDSFCDHWKSPCGVKGQCSVYNKQRFRVEMQLYSVVSVSLTILCCFLSYLLFVCCPRFSALSSDDSCGANNDNNNESNGRKKHVNQSAKKLVRKTEEGAGADTEMICYLQREKKQ